MSGQSVMSYLRELCTDMDEGRPLRRFEWRRAAATAAVPFVMGLAGCDIGACLPEYGAPPAVSEYAAPMEPMPAPVYGAPPKLAPRPPNAGQVVPPTLPETPTPPPGSPAPPQGTTPPQPPPQGVTPPPPAQPGPAPGTPSQGVLSPSRGPVAPQPVGVYGGPMPGRGLQGPDDD